MSVADADGKIISDFEEDLEKKDSNLESFKKIKNRRRTKNSTSHRYEKHSSLAFRR